MPFRAPPLAEMPLPADASPRSAAPPAAVDEFQQVRPAHLLVHGAQVVVANVVIAAINALLVGGNQGSGRVVTVFGHTVVYVQAIGLLIWLAIEFGRFALRRERHDGWPAGWRGVVLVLAACVFGYVGGTAIGDAIFGTSTWREFAGRPFALLGELGMAATFCAVVAGWFYIRARAAAHRAQMAEATHAATLARLGLLQSQLEPHMLFNTLANLRALIAADPARAQAMLDRLIDFLRATLLASRAATHPLRDEFARVDDYLALMQMRMGERLLVTTTLAPGLAAIAVPPLLLQPLVENAIKHGLEPQRGAGTLTVSATLAGATLVLSVADSGRGLEAAAGDRPHDGRVAGSGFGLAQVRERLHALYGEAARLTLEPRPEGGTLAVLRLPVAEGPG